MRRCLRHVRCKISHNAIRYFCKDKTYDWFLFFFQQILDIKKQTTAWRRKMETVLSEGHGRFAQQLLSLQCFVCVLIQHMTNRYSQEGNKNRVAAILLHNFYCLNGLSWWWAFLKLVIISQVWSQRPHSLTHGESDRNSRTWRREEDMSAGELTAPGAVFTTFESLKIS